MSNLRVISGSARGRRLKSVPGDTTRPITDRVKESLFNILGADIMTSTLLDLFAGTGAVGIEALSRGAQFVRFIDRNRLPVKIVRENLSLTGLTAQAEVFQMDAFSVLQGDVDRRFDYIYIAPPQYKSMWKQALQMLDDNIGWLAEDGWVIVQIHPVELEVIALKNLVEFDQRRYGSTLLIFYEFAQ
ncbi:MAG TPA: 16S rRNA (guanine(966)-N(2))-methyltransferase RsmD [Chloroflexi bacterium]|nr:16S rRNA (guanine(966)-N(2))-methyltransferase RsmD [Chloroflexota bacterium]HBY07112.1 16S rRNA (guanine(966)-N(2))-methyltransferase RsmD [Chloroflexota bacterium]